MINKNTIVVGAQWGDEGKGKIIDILAKTADVVVRYQGGNNAGHTVINSHGEFVLHLIPSGIFNPKSICVLGNGVVLDPVALLQEIKKLEAKNIRIKGRLLVSDRAHLIMPYHRVYDKARESDNSMTKIGTTGRGIGPSYTDKVMRIGIRVTDLYDLPVLQDKLRRVIREKSAVFTKIYGASGFSYKKIYKEYLSYAKVLKPYVCDTAVYLNDEIRKGKVVLFEGAQGTHLDVDHGTYPFVTSSNVTAGGACTGSGVAPVNISDVIGVVKAYTTRVGEGPFPTEFDDRLMAQIRSKGNEFGATTGRPRRCGWFDAVLVRSSCEINGIRQIAVTKLDVLDEMQSIKICTGYIYQGRRYSHFPASLSAQLKAKPVYETHPGWMSDTSQIKSFDKLPLNARRYLNRVSQLLGVPVTIVSVGSHERQTFFPSQKKSIVLTHK